MKIGNIDFNQEACKAMSFNNFKEMFKSFDIDHRKVFIQLGGKVKQDKKKAE